jgi:hypothetical protein
MALSMSFRLKICLNDDGDHCRLLGVVSAGGHYSSMPIGSLQPASSPTCLIRHTVEVKQ